MPIRTRRLAKAAAAITLASAPLVGFSLPALASSASPVAGMHAAGTFGAGYDAGQVPEYEWWLRTLHIVETWDFATGAGTTVAVLSDGVVTGEKYLKGSVVTGPDFTHSGRTVRSPYFGVIGTSIASLIAGHGMGDYGQGNARYVHGVAPGAKILSIRATLSPGDPLWSNNRVASRLPGAIAAGIRYAVGHGANVVALPPDPGIHDSAIASGSATASGGSAAERAAVRYALSKNVLLVAPAGDNGQVSGSAANYPAAYPGVIAVGAFDRTFDKAPYSSRQRYVTLTAAGQGVVAANRAGFYKLNSTCAASAIVAGIASLIRSEFPNLDVTQVRDSLTEGTRYHPPGGMLDGSGHGTVDASSAIHTAATMSPPHARPAMQGARPRTRPAPPAIQSSTSLIMRELTGDAAVSGIALAVLLVPIILFGVMSRRRDRQEAALAAAQSSGRAAARSGHGTMLADPLLEFFGPQHARPAALAAPTSARPSAAPRFQPRPGLTGRSTMSAALGARQSAAPAGAGTPGRGQAAHASGAAAGKSVLPVRASSAQRGESQAGGYQADAGQVVAGQLGVGDVDPARSGDALPVRQPGTGPSSAHPTVRRTPVTGTPPWEPAKQPTSELPWAVIASQPVTGGRPATGAESPAIPPPPDSVWDSTPVSRSSAPGSLFQPAPLPPDSPSAERPALPGPRPELAAAEPRLAPQPRHELAPETERGPIFAWNPSSVTDQFATIDPATTDWGRATGEVDRD